MKPKIQIGKNYLNNLSRLKHFLLNSQTMFQEEPEVLICDGQGTCHYDHCPAKEYPSDSYLAIINKNRSEFYAFHSACIDSLMDDPRLPSFN